MPSPDAIDCIKLVSQLQSLFISLSVIRWHMEPLSVTAADKPNCSSDLFCKLHTSSSGNNIVIRSAMVLFPVPVFECVCVECNRQG